MPEHISTRMPCTEEPTPHQRSRAVRAVAGHARDAAELTEMLDMLGLDASEAGEPAREEPAREPTGPTGEPRTESAGSLAAAEPVRGRRERLSVAELNALFARAR